MPERNKPETAVQLKIRIVFVCESDQSNIIQNVLNLSLSFFLKIYVFLNLQNVARTDMNTILYTCSDLRVTLLTLIDSYIATPYYFDRLSSNNTIFFN